MTYTAQDVVHHLLAATAGGAQDGEHAAVRLAVVHGAREVFQSRQWLWHTKTGQFTIQANQSSYDLPPNVKEIDTLMTQTVGTLHCYVPPNEWLRLQVNTVGSGEPYYYTIMRSDNEPDRYQVRFVGQPAAGTVAHYTYRYIPKELKYMGYEKACRDGTVSASVSGTTQQVIGTGTSFPPDCAGCVIRFGTTTRNADPVGSLSPFLDQRTITQRASDTLLVLDDPVTTATNVRYAITDVLDASPQMYTALLSGAEMWYARLTNKSANEALVVFTRDLRLAMEMDAPSPHANQMRHAYPTARSHGWYSPLQPDAV